MDTLLEAYGDLWSRILWIGLAWASWVSVARWSSAAMLTVDLRVDN